ncbi:MAG: hypothetical protein J0L62_11970 [Bacteroidetes bacterium]|nr:hypothetical protein [Bacteroidota bacterium]
MKKVFIFGLAILSFSSLLTQSSSGQGVASKPFLFTSNGFNSIYLDQNGYNPVFSSFSGNPATSNPAGFSNDEKIHIWGKWAKNSEIKNAWFGMGCRQLKPEIPSGIGVSIPVLGLSVTAGFTRSINYTLYSEDISRTSPDDPNGSGSTFDYYDDARLDIYSFTVSGNLMLSKVDFSKLAYGFTVKYGKLKVKSAIDKEVYDSKDDIISFAFGAIYSANPEFAEKLRVGIFCETKESYSGTGFYKPNVNGGYLPAKFSSILISGPIKFEANLPTRVHFGTEITYQSGIQTLFQGSLLMWETAGFLAKNQTELSGSVVYPVFESVKVSGGLLWDSWYTNKDSGISLKNSDFRSIFLTTGIHAGFNGFLIDLALANNHLLSGKYRKQTILTAGVGYEF